jgi:hypothetical protein
MNRYNIIFKKSIPILTVPISHKTVKIIDHIRAENIEKAIESIKRKHGKGIWIIKIEDCNNN